MPILRLKNPNNEPLITSINELWNYVESQQRQLDLLYKMIQELNQPTRGGSMSLDQKLKEILTKVEYGNTETWGTQEWAEVIAQLKQAFESDGYMNFRPMVVEALDKVKLEPIMTGQAFYERFKEELAHQWDARDDGEEGLNEYLILEAAKKAAGLNGQ